MAQKVFQSYQGLLLEDETITEVKIEEEFEGCENYVQGMFDIENKYLSRCETASDRVDGSLVKSASISVVNTDSKITNRLSKIELTKYKGNLEDWLSWWGQFSKITDDETLEDVDKFHYLIQAVVEGSRAQRLVCSYPITEDNYPKVIQALKDRFGDKNLLIEHYIRRLLKLVVSNARKENIPLDDIYDDLTAHLKNLESLGRNPAVGYGIKEKGAGNGDKSDAGGRLQALMDFLRDELNEGYRFSTKDSQLFQVDKKKVSRGLAQEDFRELRPSSINDHISGLRRDWVADISKKAVAHHQQETNTLMNQPPCPCKICASHQLPNQINFHRDFPLKKNTHPKRIHPEIPKYDGTEDPRQWIESLEEIGFLYHWADYIIARYAAMNMTEAPKPAIRFPAMEEETKIKHVIGGLKKEYLFALYLNPPKTNDELLVVCEKIDSFEKKYRERVEKSRNLYNGPRYSIPQQQSSNVPPTDTRKYQTTNRTLAPVSKYYKNDSPPTPRQYRNNLLQPSTSRRPYIQTFCRNQTFRETPTIKAKRFKLSVAPESVNQNKSTINGIEKLDPKYKLKINVDKIGTFEALVDRGADLSVVDIRTALDTGHERYGDLFSSRLWRTNLGKHWIGTEDAKPIKHKPYRSGTNLSSKISSYSRGTLIEKTEKALVIWIEDLTQKIIPLDGHLIKMKALKFYKELKESEPSTSSRESNPQFSASTGWLTGFIKRHSFHNLKIKGEVASADEEAARKYPEKLAKIIKDGGYCAHIKSSMLMKQDCFRKKCQPVLTLQSPKKNASGFKAAKDRVTLLLCSNASGDRMLKPLLVNRSLKPRALKGKDLNTLPVHWMANKKAWVTTAIFTEWFNKCFVPEVENYMKEMGLEFKILLILDNAPAAWPECVSKRNESNRTTIVTSDIISIAKEIGGEGFDDFGEHDIEELLVDEALNDYDILESMVDTTKDFETVDSEVEDVTPLDEKLLREGLQLSGKLENIFIQNDNDVERALKFQRDLKFCMSGYRELYKELVKPSQRLITDYLVKEKKITEVPKEALPCRSDDVILSSSDESDLAPIHKRKRDGKCRFCVDYRKLNNVTGKYVYPIPRINEVMHTLQGSTYFSAIDLRSGYWQVEVVERDKEKTAFTTAHGLCEFHVMPF
ncbi:hypothetical protein LAZ67_21001340 [Cordylochernes scorpioides]|uniref:Uncharacterized protein n=1 Tax=Cordylochernes scorpioides TaxID=51811 RepID=A0ABY6LLY8_9ARAC|nr:hypothetical protein LAZ67_21001340 [Cordylochernes scorpioides]